MMLRDQFTPEDSHGFVQAFENRILRCLKKRKSPMSQKNIREIISPQKNPGGFDAFNRAFQSLLRSGEVAVVGKNQKDNPLYALNR
jgi:hypothetical protein